MRPLGQQHPVLEGAGFALIGIADDEAPLGALSWAAMRHLRPVVNPAPPQPRKPLSSIIEIIWEEVMLTALERPASSGTGPRSTGTGMADVVVDHAHGTLVRRKVGEAVADKALRAFTGLDRFGR
jgi:hypothetical protein